MAEVRTETGPRAADCSDSIPGHWAERLVNDHWADLVRCASIQLGESDPSAAEDLAADVICSLFEGTFDGRNVPPQRALAFAKAVTRNRAMHWLRRSNRIHVLPADTPDPRPTDSWAGAAAVRKKMAVRHAVSHLPSDYRRAVVMYYFRGWSIPDIALREHTTTGAIRVRLSRARAMLREELRPFRRRL